LASSLPIVRQIAWLSVVPQLLLMAALIAAAKAFGFDDPLLAGVLAYLLLLLTLRRLVPKHHRAGLRLFKQEHFAEAIVHFQKSYDFFVKHQWVDRWRALTMLSSSRVSYREMALLNHAFCLGQTGQRTQAVAVYRQALTEFPASKMAQSALRMMDDGSAPGQPVETG
jgi:hypothetical protein